MRLNKKIIAIERIRANDASQLRRMSESLVQVPTDISWENIPIKVPAELTISSKTEDKVRLYTAKLTFSLLCEVTIADAYVYRCQMANGKHYIIGDGDRPYTIAEISESIPDGNDSQLREVTVNYTSTKPIAMET